MSHAYDTFLGMGSKYGVTLIRSDHLALVPHSDAPGEDGWRAWVEGLDKPVAVDLFCGAGGLSLGLQQAGFEVAVAVDNDERCLATHQANFPGRVLKMDLADPEQVNKLVKLLSDIEIAVLAGGPPCQPFSRAGRSKIRSLVEEGTRPPVDDRRDLWRVFVELAERLLPSAVLFENVPDIALADESRLVREMAANLEQIGYNVEYRLLDAWRYGVPQHRQRLILVATQNGIGFDWPEPSEDRVTVKDAIADLPLLKMGTGDRCLDYDKPSNRFQQVARAGMPEGADSLVWDHMTRPVRDDDREAFALMKPNTRYSDLPERLRRYRSDIFDDKYKRLDWDDLSRTITAHIAKDGYWYIHPSEHRTLTVREAARLQTFPDRFRFEGTRSHAYTQIGNAVPPILATFIAKALLNALKKNSIQSSIVTVEQTNTSIANLHSWFRQKILDWTPSGSDLWRRINEPWPVLVSTICGRKGSNNSLAHKIIEISPESFYPQEENFNQLKYLLGGRRINNRRVLRSIQAARSISQEGWEGTKWAELAKIGTSDTRWVEAVGLGKDYLITTAGVLRVAHRFNGRSSDTSAQTRVVLAQLIGKGQAIQTTIAMAALATELCTATSPRCADCPLVNKCTFAQSKKQQKACRELASGDDTT